MLKVGFDAQKIFVNKSGLGNYSRNSVELLSRFYPENEYSLFTAFDENSVGFTIPAGMKVINPSTAIGNIVPWFWRECNMAGDIRRERLDIFHGLCNELPLDIRFSGAKSVVTLHDLVFLRFPNLYNKFERLFYSINYRRSCSNADIIIATSQQTKQDLIDFWNISPERISVVYQGCNSSFRSEVSEEVKSRVRERYNLPQEFMLSVGRFEERKNLMLTLHAMYEGKIDMPLVACGHETPYIAKLKEYIAANGMEDRVIFIHDLDLGELPSLFQMASVVVYVSLFEGFGIPILESFYSKTPVITTRGGVFTEVGGDGALYVGPYDLEEMIETLRKVLSDSDFRSQTVAKGYEYAQNFNDDKIADNLMEVYNMIL